MKTIILKSNLKGGLDAVGRTIGTNTNLPILGSVLIYTDAGQIKLSTTNLELAMTKSVFGKVIEEGGIAVPYPVISSIVNNISTERVNLEVKQNNLIIKTDNYEASVQGADRKEFPIIPSIDAKEKHLEVEGGVLRDTLSKTVVAAEVSDLRPEISGVLFEVEPKALKVVATDSFRLAEGVVSGNQVKGNLDKGFSVTIPLKTAQELARVVGDKEKIKFFADETQVLFESEELELISRTIEGTFPDYKAIVPKEIETRVLVGREELMSGLKLAGSFSGRNNEVVLRVKDKKTLEIYSSDSHLGENNYLVPVKGEGPETEVVFNWQYLLDGIKNEQDKEVVLGFNGQEKPTMIRSSDNSPYYYILMPIKP